MSIPAGSLAAVPLFPLPNVVLFPRAVLPLHIFEDRYKAMTADVLAGNRLIAMSLLKPGWERDYYKARVINESKWKGYRVAELTALAETETLEIDLEQHRSHLIELFSAVPFGALP